MGRHNPLRTLVDGLPASIYKFLSTPNGAGFCPKKTCSRKTKRAPRFWRKTTLRPSHKRLRPDAAGVSEDGPNLDGVMCVCVCGSGFHFLTTPTFDSNPGVVQNPPKGEPLGLSLCWGSQKREPWCVCVCLVLTWRLYLFLDGLSGKLIGTRPNFRDPLKKVTPMSDICKIVVP